MFEMFRRLVSSADPSVEQAKAAFANPPAEGHLTAAETQKLIARVKTDPGDTFISLCMLSSHRVSDESIAAAAPHVLERLFSSLEQEAAHSPGQPVSFPGVYDHDDDLSPEAPIIQELLLQLDPGEARVLALRYIALRFRSIEGAHSGNDPIIGSLGVFAKALDIGNEVRPLLVEYMRRRELSLTASPDEDRLFWNSDTENIDELGRGLNALGIPWEPLAEIVQARLLLNSVNTNEPVEGLPRAWQILRDDWNQAHNINRTMDAIYTLHQLLPRDEEVLKLVKAVCTGYFQKTHTEQRWADPAKIETVVAHFGFTQDFEAPLNRARQLAAIDNHDWPKYLELRETAPVVEPGVIHKALQSSLKNCLESRRFDLADEMNAATGITLSIGELARIRTSVVKSVEYAVSEGRLRDALERTEDLKYFDRIGARLSGALTAEPVQ